MGNIDGSETVERRSRLDFWAAGDVLLHSIRVLHGRLALRNGKAAVRPFRSGRSIPAIC